MDIKKTAQDAGYIAVGAGVIGFQQAQVRRHELTSDAGRRLQDARACLESQAATLRARVGGQAQETRSRIENRATSLTERATTLTDDVLEWVDPVVGDLKVRVEPIVEQLQALPVQFSKAVDAAGSRVRELVNTAA